MLKKRMLVVLLALSSMAAWSQDTETASPSGEGVYIIAYRTPAHVRSSSPEVFHAAAADVRTALTDHGVVLVPDKERGFIENQSPMSTESMTALAEESGAASLLLLTVDRPMTKWLKLTLQAYDLDGQKLWQESVDNGMSGMSGSSGYENCFRNLGKVLSKRVGSPGLPAQSRHEPGPKEKP